MRLVCPNCAAQYEVDNSAIPETGRDVQCANCGNTWFQDPPVPLTRPRQPTPPEETRDADARGAEGSDGTADNDTASAAPDEDAADDQDKPRTSERPEARPTDPSVLDILRREAEHESARREADGGSAKAEAEAASETREAADDDDAAETGADIAKVDAPIDDDPSEDDPADEDSLAIRAQAARSRLTAMQSERPDRVREQRLHLSAVGEDAGDADTYEDEVEDDDAAAPAPRRGKTRAADLPDIDELNSTLRSAGNEDRLDQDQLVDFVESRSRRSDRLGFYLAILIGLVLLAVYALEAQIAAALPEAAPYLESYTTIVNAARLRFAGAVASLIEAAQNLMAQVL